MTVQRRTVLLGAAGAGGLLGAGRLLGGASGTVSPSRSSMPDLADGDGRAMLDADPVSHLVRRVAPAPTRTLVETVHELGPSSWLEGQLGQASPESAHLAAVLTRLPSETSTVADYLDLQRDARDARQARAADGAATPEDRGRPLPPAAELGLSVLLRRVLGTNHLRESLTELWGDVLHVHVGHDLATQLFTPFLVRDVLRPGALGRFDDLLVAVTTSPAMLVYLDGARSRDGAVNENHARELLELHTVGVDHHDEDDVAAVARVLTGWTVQPRSGTSVFLDRRHDPTPVTVLGWSGTGGSEDPEDLLRHLARLPATATRVARALAVRFVADDPPDDLVAQLAARYLEADTEIAPVVADLLASDAFATAVGAKLRRPLEHLSTALAVTGPSLFGAGPGFRRVVEHLGALGHVPHGWPAPDGHPDVAGAWVSSAAALGRWSLAAAVAELAAGDGTDPEAVLDDAVHELLLAPLPTDVRDVVLRTAATTPDPAVAVRALALDLPAAHLR